MEVFMYDDDDCDDDDGEIFPRDMYTNPVSVAEFPARWSDHMATKHTTATSDCHYATGGDG